MNLGSRIRAAREHMGWSIKDLERRCGVASLTISALEARDSKRSEYAEQIVGAFPPELVSLEWLRSGAGQMLAEPGRTALMPGASRAIQPIEDGAEPPDGVTYIQESELRLAGGGGQAVYTDTPGARPVPYLSSWLRAQGIPPGRARRFKVRGDSMEATLYDGDTVLVDTADTTIVDGKVYAFTFDGELKVKRLYRRLAGGLIIHSDNPHHMPRDEEVGAELADQRIRIIGRVKDRSGRGGL